LRATVTGLTDKPPLEPIDDGGTTPPKGAYTGDRDAYFVSLQKFSPVPTFGRPPLLAGNRIEGPAIVEEHASTTVLMPDDILRVDAFGNLDIQVGKMP
jgi:N-methylhydantoinase A